MPPAKPGVSRITPHRSEHWLNTTEGGLGYETRHPLPGISRHEVRRLHRGRRHKTCQHCLTNNSNSTMARVPALDNVLWTPRNDSNSGVPSPPTSPQNHLPAFLHTTTRRLVASVRGNRPMTRGALLALFAASVEPHVSDFQCLFCRCGFYPMHLSSHEFSRLKGPF